MTGGARTLRSFAALAVLVGGECTAADRVHVWMHAYIPNLVGSNDAFVQTAKGPAIKAPAFGCFSIDAANPGTSPTASSRLTTEFDVVVDGRTLTIEPHTGRAIHRVSDSHKVDCQSGAVLETRRGSASGMTVGEVKESRLARAVFLQASVANPFLFPPFDAAIDYALSMRFDLVSRKLEIRGTYDGFPGYAAYYSLNGGPPVRLLDYTPKTGPGSLVDLWGALGTRSFEGEVQLP